MRGLFYQLFIETQILASKDFGNILNLAKVEAEVVDSVVDGVESARFVALNFVGREQLVYREPVKHFCRLVQGDSQPLE